MKVLIAAASHRVEHGCNLLFGEAGLLSVRIGRARRRGRGRKGGGRSRRQIGGSRLLILQLRLRRLLILLLLHLRLLLIELQLRLHLHHRWLHLHLHLRLHQRLLHLHVWQRRWMRFRVRRIAPIFCVTIGRAVVCVRSNNSRGGGGPQDGKGGEAEVNEERRDGCSSRIGAGGRSMKRL